MDKLHNYFNDRYRRAVLAKPEKDAGPVITISRTTGCDGRQVAEELVEQLNRRSNSKKWRWIDKDIIYKAAREVNIGAHRVETIYKGAELSNMSEIIMAFSGSFVSDMKIKRAIREVVLSICKEGFIVIVGRGGAVISADIPDALHIRIIAPFYWRVNNVMRKKNFEISRAEKFVIETDQKRMAILHSFMDKKPLNLDYLFDATLNRASFEIGELSNLIMEMYLRKVCRKNTKGIC